MYDKFKLFFMRNIKIRGHYIKESYEVVHYKLLLLKKTILMSVTKVFPENNIFLRNISNQNKKLNKRV